MGLDTSHTTVEGKLTDVQFDEDSQTRADISFETVPPETEEEEEQTDDYEPRKFNAFRTYRFALSQLLKFADLKKRELKEEVELEDGETTTRTREDAREIVLDELEGKRFQFKYNDNGNKKQVCSVLSPRYATIRSEEVDQLVQTKLAEMGIEEPERIVRRRGFVVELDYRWDDQKELPDVGDTLGAGISVRNSAFGASSLRVDRYYTVLACQNGMRVKEGGREVRYNHVGDESELRQEFEEVLENEVETLWENTDFIDRVASIPMSLEEQIDFVENLGENGRITKTAANTIMEELENPEESDWNLTRENAWNVVNGLTGYQTHAGDMGQELSDNSIKRLERTYNKILQANNKEEVLDIA